MGGGEQRPTQTGRTHRAELHRCQSLVGTGPALTGHITLSRLPRSLGYQRFVWKVGLRLVSPHRAPGGSSRKGPLSQCAMTPTQSRGRETPHLPWPLPSPGPSNSNWVNVLRAPATQDLPQYCCQRLPLASLQTPAPACPWPAQPTVASSGSSAPKVLSGPSQAPNTPSIHGPMSLGVGRTTSFTCQTRASGGAGRAGLTQHHRQAGARRPRSAGRRGRAEGGGGCGDTGPWWRGPLG